MSLTPTDWLYLPKSHCGAGIVNGSATKWDEAVGGEGEGGGGAPMGLPFRLAPLSPHILNALQKPTSTVHLQVDFVSGLRFYDALVYFFLHHACERRQPLPLLTVLRLFPPGLHELGGTTARRCVME